jgi:predicted flavoprotein YhiN
VRKNWKNLSLCGILRLDYQEDKKSMSNVVVIGGGAAGMMAAYQAATMGHQVTLMEQNEKLGKKIYITGKGRCNLTNASDMETIRAHVITNPKFLYSAFAAMDNQDVITLMESHGCKTKVERGNRVFPVSDHASDVIRAMERAMAETGVILRLNTRVLNLVIEDGCCRGVVCQELTPFRPGGKLSERLPVGKRETVFCDAVIVATGGESYPSTGSTGDGYRFAESAGIQVTGRHPALVPFESKETWLPKLQGLSLRNVRVSIEKEGKILYTEFGEMLFTHFGVSGPALLSASSVVGTRLPAKLFIDLKPALTEEQLDERMLRDFAKENNKQIQNGLGGLYPSKLIPVILQVAGISPEKRVNEITREERGRLRNCTKRFPVSLSGLRGFEEAIITQGGVSVKEIKAGTMESKKVAGL